MQRNQVIPILGALAVAASAHAAKWSWHQPWNLQLDSHSSRVEVCPGDDPFPLLAFDDFEIDIAEEEDVRIRYVSWWGVLSPEAEAVLEQGGTLPFRIAIYLDDDCDTAEGMLRFEKCVESKGTVVGTDCTGATVYRFRARLLPGGFVASPGEHYWLSIAEVENGSPSEGEDFRWSGHRRPRLCDAMQKTVGWLFTLTPLFSVCDEEVNDLAFILRGRSIKGTLTSTWGDGPFGATLEIRERDDGTLLESHPVWIDAQGVFFAEPTVPDGQYRAVLKVPGALPQAQPIVLGPMPTETEWNLTFGDLDGDGLIDFDDLLGILAGWSR